MATMEEFKGKAVDAAQIAARAAKHVAFMTKKHMEIAREQEKIRRNYTRLGKVYYKDYVTDEEPDDAEYQPLCDAISDSYKLINDLRTEMENEKADYTGQKAEKKEEPAEETGEEQEVLEPAAEEE